MTTPFFSIVTAVFNAEDVLAKTATSLCDQTFRDFEWIVVDGGSTDATLDIARQFAVNDRDTIVSESDQGVYDAMNKGLRLARGSVVQFLNAGDCLADETVLAQVAAAFEDEPDAVYGDTILVLADGRTVRRTALDPAEHLKKRMPISHQAFFATRDLHLRYPFDLTFKIAADYAAIAGMHQAGAQMTHLRAPTNINTIEPDAISVAGRVKSAAEDYRIHVEILGRPRVEAMVYYLHKRVVILGVGVLGSLPSFLFDRLPAAIRRRVY